MRRHAYRLFALSITLLSIVSAACGDNGGTGGGGDGGTGGGGDGGTGGGGDGGTGGGGNGGGGNGGGGNDGGVGGQACDHESAGGGSEGPTCGSGELRIAGDIDGSPVDDTLRPGWGMAAGHTFIETSTFGLMYFPDVEATPGVATDVRGLIRFPDESDLAGSWYCAGKGSEIFVTPGGFVPFTTTLDSLSLLGSCEGGTPVSGEVELCLDASDCDVGWRSVSTIEGASFDVEIAGGYAEYSPNSAAGGAALVFQHPTSTTPFAGSGFIKLEAKDIDGSEPNTTKTISLARGFFVVPLGAPDAGAVYCTGEGSSLDYQVDDQGVLRLQRSTFTNLKRIGACPAAHACVSGQLRICGQ